MAPELIDKSHNNEQETNRDLLYDLVMRVAKEENFEIAPLEPKFQDYYTEMDPTQGDRCVDGRPVLEMAGKDETGYKGSEYKGAQIPGGTLGELDVLKKITGLDEDKAREVIKSTYKNNGLKLGAHIDDGHGDIESLAVLKERKIGCGDQTAKQKHLLRMYARTPFTKTLYGERLEWIRENGGSVFPLSGSHDENVSAINLIENTTFDTHKAAGEEDSVFSCDVAEIHKRAGLLFDEMVNKNHISGLKTRDDFQKSFTEEAVRNYFQTLMALGQRAQIFIRN